jgi:hypothetical protein
MDLNQAVEYIAQELPRLIELQKTVSAAQARADVRFSEFAVKIDAYIDRTDARLQRLETAEADWRAGMDAWQVRMDAWQVRMDAWQARIEIMEGNIADLIRALRNDHPNGSKQGE